jgi:predicted RNase H-like HicB family nuclease
MHGFSNEKEAIKIPEQSDIAGLLHCLGATEEEASAMAAKMIELAQEKAQDKGMLIVLAKQKEEHSMLTVSTAIGMYGSEDIVDSLLTLTLLKEPN